VVVSKPIAARWAQAGLDGRWTPLIQAALAWSSDTVPDLGDTLRFINATLCCRAPLGLGSSAIKQRSPTDVRLGQERR
jgi:hypothetical protein